MQRAKIDISKVIPNEGQLEGLPRNPRLIKDEKFRKLCRSIQSLPENDRGERYSCLSL